MTVVKNTKKCDAYWKAQLLTVAFTSTECPGIFDLAGRGKWNAWDKKKGRILKNIYKNVTSDSCKTICKTYNVCLKMKL